MQMIVNDMVPEAGETKRTDDDGVIAAQLPALMRYALVLAGNADLAQDLVQDCIARALDRRHLLRGGADPRPWLFTIMRNLHVNGRRQAGRRSTLAATRSAALCDDVAPGQEHVAELRRVARAVAALPPDQRRVIHLVVLQELSYREAAQRLAIPVGTVMSRLARGRERIRELLEPR